MLSGSILHTDIGVEEVEYAIRKLKRDHAGGHDNISPEHLKFSGPVFQNWLCHNYVKSNLSTWADPSVL